MFYYSFDGNSSYKLTEERIPLGEFRKGIYSVIDFRRLRRPGSRKWYCWLAYWIADEQSFNMRGHKAYFVKVFLFKVTQSTFTLTDLEQEVLQKGDVSISTRHISSFISGFETYFVIFTVSRDHSEKIHLDSPFTKSSLKVIVRPLILKPWMLAS